MCYIPSSFVVPGKKLAEGTSVSPPCSTSLDEKKAKVIVPLPDAPLCQELKDEIQKLKIMASKHQKGKGIFFNADVNKVLLKYV